MMLNFGDVGSVGLYMALVFALAGITTARESLLGLNSSHVSSSKTLL